MKICIFSDVHGNIAFLDAFLEACKEKEIDRYFFLGDSVGYLPFGKQVLARLREIDAVCLKGNHEAMLLGMLPVDEEKDRVYYLRRQMGELDEEDFLFIRTWPITRQQEVDGINLHFVHGTIDDPLKGYGYEQGDMASFNNPEIDVLFFGQTHRPWKVRNADTQIVNVGSVGLPRDIGNSPAFVIFDTLTKSVSIERIEVDPAPLFAMEEGIHPSVIQCLRRR